MYLLRFKTREYNNTVRNYVSTKVRMAKKEYYYTSFNNCSEDMKKICNTIKKILENNTTKEPIKKLIVNGIEIRDDEEIANCFNIFFLNIAKKLDNYL